MLFLDKTFDCFNPAYKDGGSENYAYPLVSVKVANNLSEMRLNEIKQIE